MRLTADLAAAAANYRAVKEKSRLSASSLTVTQFDASPAWSAPRSPVFIFTLIVLFAPPAHATRRTTHGESAIY